MSYDPSRLLVAHALPNGACKTPHFSADVITALRAVEEVRVVGITFMPRLRMVLHVHGEEVVVEQSPDPQWILVTSGNRVVRVDAWREETVPVAHDGREILDDLQACRVQGRALQTTTAVTVTFDTVHYLDPSVVVDGVRLLVGTSVA